MEILEIPGLNKRRSVDRISTMLLVVSSTLFIILGVERHQSLRRLYNCVENLWVWGPYGRLLSKK
jgi:hypothetical protein